MKKTVIMENGKRFPIIAETDRFYVCKRMQFRKSNKHIRVEVEEEPVVAEEVTETELKDEELFNNYPNLEEFDFVNTEQAEEKKEEVPAKKKSMKKKEETEDQQKGE